jgi:hypothetical protein
MRKSQWFWLGLFGTLVGMAVRLVRGRRGHADLDRWEPPGPNS